MTTASLRPYPKERCDCGGEWKFKWESRAKGYAVYRCSDCYSVAYAGEGWREDTPLCPCGFKLTKHARYLGMHQLVCSRCNRRYEWAPGQPLQEPSSHWVEKRGPRGPNKAAPGERKAAREEAYRQRRVERLANKKSRALARIKDRQPE